MGCGPSKDKKDPKSGDAVTETAAKPAAKPDAKPAAAKPSAEAKPAAEPQRPNNTDSHMSDALKDLINDYFNRYDLDGSGTINSSEELKQLCTNLVVKLDLDMEVAEIDAKVKAAGAFKDDKDAKESDNNWDVESFKHWFINDDNFKDVPKTWEHGDESDEDDEQNTATKPFFTGTYIGELVSEDKSKKYTLQMKKGQGKLNPKTKRYDEYKLEAVEQFSLKVRAEEGGKLKPRSGCDSVGYFRATGQISGDTIEYTMAYDIDNDKATAEPNLVLKGKVTADGKTIEGTWENTEKDAAAQKGMKDIGLEGVDKGVFKLEKRQRDE